MFAKQALQFFPFAPVPGEQWSPQRAGVAAEQARHALTAADLPPQPERAPVVAPAGPAGPQPAREAAPYIHPHTRTIVCLPTRDGTDYVKVCPTHQWASRPIVDRELAEQTACPICEADEEAVCGGARYRALHARLVW